MSLKETVTRLMCVAVMLACFFQTASADWYDDIKPNSTWLPIEGENFVADTFMGVPALYNESNRNYQCGELIIRFYKEAYGIDVYPYTGGTPDSNTSNYEFVKTSTPKKGDIIYVSKEMRGSSQDHWAIVKDYSDGYITMFEQNAVHNGGAAYERKIKYPSDSYYIYTPVGKGDTPDPVLKTAGTVTPPLQNAKPVEPSTQVTTKPAVTEPVTEKTTQPATEEPTTTTVPVTTVSKTEKVSTTVSHTKPVTTETTLAVTAEDVSSTLPDVTVPSELNTTHKATLKYEESVAESETDSANTEETKKETVKKIAIAAGACTILVAVAAAVIALARTRRK